MRQSLGCRTPEAHTPSRVPSLWAGNAGVVEEMVMIARMWRGWVRTEQANAYVAYITGTGFA